MPSGVQPMIEHMASSKDVEKINRRYQRELEQLEQLLECDGVNQVLSHRLGGPLNKEGEYCGEPFVETLKSITTETIAEFRAEDLRPIEKKEYWKM